MKGAGKTGMERELYRTGGVSEGYGLLQAAEKVLVQDETLPQRLKPNSFQSIRVRPKQAAEKGTIVAIFF